MPLLDHVGIRVTDLNRAVHFYKEVFGFEEVERRRLDGRDIDSVALRVGTNLIFLLYHPHYKSQDPNAAFGIDHIAISYDAAEWERITIRTRELGVKIVRELPRVLGSTGWGPCQYVNDPDGNEIEIKNTGTFGSSVK